MAYNFLKCEAVLLGDEIKIRQGSGIFDIENIEEEANHMLLAVKKAKNWQNERNNEIQPIIQ